MRPKSVIVSSEPGVVAWLNWKGVKAPVVTAPTAGNVRDCHVYGELPLTLAAEAASLTVLEMDFPPSPRSLPALTARSIDQARPHLTTYVVRRIGDD